MVMEIFLTQGKVALVDDEDYEYLNQWKWCWRQGYAIRSIVISPRSSGKFKTKTISMHRLVNKTPEGMDTDHIDSNKTNNQKANLRSCSHRENTKNRSKTLARRSSKYKGVSWHAHRQKWQANIKSDYGQEYLGLFDLESDAAQAYNFAALKHFGEFAKMNVYGEAP